MRNRADGTGTFGFVFGLLKDICKHLVRGGKHSRLCRKELHQRAVCRSDIETRKLRAGGTKTKDSAHALL